MFFSCENTLELQFDYDQMCLDVFEMVEFGFGSYDFPLSISTSEPEYVKLTLLFLFLLELDDLF